MVSKAVVFGVILLIAAVFWWFIRMANKDAYEGGFSKGAEKKHMTQKEKLKYLEREYT